ncbi:MAG: bifunctional phosphoglucose/phosphomannose isomerase [Actinomycetota bacterium]
MKARGGLDLDDTDAVSKGDPAGMLDAVLSLPRRLRAGFEAGRSLSPLPDASSLSAIVLCGMGGSGVAGDVVRALYRDRLTIPLEVVKDAVLPEFCGRDTLVVCSSFSGNTAETLACFDAASDRGCRLLALSTGGELAVRAAERGVPTATIPDDAPAPRAALGELLGASLGALESMGLLPPVVEDIDESAGGLEDLAEELGPGVELPDNPAKVLATWIGERVAVVWGAEGIASVAATRWKTELNENAKTPAFSSSLPELDHNEVVGWTKAKGQGFVVIALRHHDESGEVAVRFPVSLQIAAEAGCETQEVWAAGQSPLAKALSLSMMGSAASVYLGLLRGVDPTPIEAIDRLKRVLAEMNE